jgi:hypothetical protein
MEYQVASQGINIVLLILAILGGIGTLSAILWRSYSVGKVVGKENEKISDILEEIKLLKAQDVKLELESKTLAASMVKLELDVIKEIREIKPEKRPCHYFEELNEDYKDTKKNIFEKVNSMAVDIGKIKTAIELMRKEAV